MAAKKSARKKSVSQKPAKKKTAAKKPARKPARKLAAKSPAARQQPSSPPVAKKPPTGPAVVHWEVQAADLAKQQTFFSDLFGWTIDTNNPMNYGMVAAGGDGAIGGGIGPTTDTSRVTVYVQVPDINAALAKAESLGARTVMPRMEYGAIVMGQFSDLEGNVIGLVEGR